MKNSAKEFMLVHKVSLSGLAVVVIALIVWIGYSNPQIGAPSASAGLAASGLPLASTTIARIDVNYGHPNAIQPGVPVPLTFTMYNAQNGDQLTQFDLTHDELLHLIIVNDALTYYDHVHPTFDGSQFSINYTFPKADNYRVYLDFQPTGADEQIFGFSQQVGSASAANAESASEKMPPVDQILGTAISKKFGQYAVTLSSRTWNASDIASGVSPIVYTFADATTGAPITDLHPYLGAFGHLVMINESNYTFLHVHPIISTITTDEAGPTVVFTPLSLGGTSVTPGTYRLFGQFNGSKGVFTTDFTVTIK